MSEISADKERTILHCAVLESPPEKVFEALTTAQSLEGFFADKAEFERTLGGQWRMVGDSSANNTEGSGTVLAWEPPHLVRLEWNWHRDDLHPTEVTYRLLPHEKGSLLVVHHRGWGSGAAWDSEHANHSESWPKVIASLAKFMGVAAPWVSHASGQKSSGELDGYTRKILEGQRDAIKLHHSEVCKDVERLQKEVNKLKKSTGVVNLKGVDKLEAELEAKEAEARRLEMDLKDVEFLTV